MASAPDLVALLDEGDAMAGRSDMRGAVAHYQAALKAAQHDRLRAPALFDRLESARSYVRRAMQQFEEALDRAVDSPDRDDPVGSLRLSHALDVVKGRRTLYPHQPALFAYPYLAVRQFFERSEFDWVDQLEARVPDILEELRSALHQGAPFKPYVENDPTRPFRDFHGLNENHAWTALYLWKHGEFQQEAAALFPRTVEAMKAVPLSSVGKRTPSVFFSRLEPGAHIPAHAGMLNVRLICHLPLIVPDGCWLRVGNETREWRKGELLIFDDSIEHEARNPTAEPRVVLIFDIWRPELSEQERDGISTIFNAIDDFTSVTMR